MNYERSIILKTKDNTNDFFKSLLAVIYLWRKYEFLISEYKMNKEEFDRHTFFHSDLGLDVHKLSLDVRFSALDLIIRLKEKFPRINPKEKKSFYEEGARKMLHNERISFLIDVNELYGEMVRPRFTNKFLKEYVGDPHEK